MTSVIFKRLCDSFREAAGLPDLAMQETPSGITTMMLAIGGVDVQICRLAHDPARLHVLTDIGSASAFPDSAAGDLAEVNTWLLAHPQGALICRRPVTHDYVLWLSLPMNEALTGPLLLEDIKRRVASALAIRTGLAAGHQATEIQNQFA